MPRIAPANLSLRLVFARYIRLMRIHAGMSQERLAAEAGLDRAFVGRLERCQRNISIDNILFGGILLPSLDAPPPVLRGAGAAQPR